MEEEIRYFLWHFLSQSSKFAGLLRQKSTYTQMFRNQNNLCTVCSHRLRKDTDMLNNTVCLQTRAAQFFSVSCSLLNGFTQTQPTDLSQKQLKTPFTFVQWAHELPHRATPHISPHHLSVILKLKPPGCFPIYLDEARLERFVDWTAKSSFWSCKCLTLPFK